MNQNDDNSDKTLSQQIALYWRVCFDWFKEMVGANLLKHLTCTDIDSIFFVAE